MSSPEDSATEKSPTSLSTQLAGDRLISIADIRKVFGLGRSAAYALTHRPGFPAPVPVSPRCYRWWASEVHAFADSLRRERAQGAPPRATKPRSLDPATPPRRITGNVRAARTGKREER
jgi:predicted DNA-binding transcriptional regulator AlpA